MFIKQEVRYIASFGKGTILGGFLKTPKGERTIALVCKPQKVESEKLHFNTRVRRQ